MKYCLITIILFGFIRVKSQQLYPEGMFLADSIRVGEVVGYALSIKYPAEMEVVFPDSSFNYAPFEFVSKQFFVSQNDSTTIADSVVYHLTTFEIEPVQKIALPVFFISHKDSIISYSNADSLFFKEMVPTLPDSVALKEDVAYLNVNKAFNYPYLMIGIGILVIISGLIYALFGKRIRQRIVLYRLEKSYLKFRNDFDSMYGDLRKTKDQLVTEKLLILWKRYMERLEERPYTKLTSNEIAALSDATKFAGTLKHIDKSIYGSASVDFVYEHIEHLEDITNERYLLKVDKIKNG